VAHRSICLLVACISLATVGCHGSATHSSNTSVSATSTAPTEAATPQDPTTQASISLIEQLKPALLQASDVPAGLNPLNNHTAGLARLAIPGLTSGAGETFTSYGTSDGAEFLSELVIIPNDRTVLANLLGAFGNDEYKKAATGYAKDAQGSFVTFANAPSGSMALEYSGTSATRSQLLKGQAVSFVRGPAYVVLLHGWYGGPPHSIELGALANSIDQRLAGLNVAN
jgi:hypothetical protein